MASLPTMRFTYLSYHTFTRAPSAWSSSLTSTAPASWAISDNGKLPPLAQPRHAADARCCRVGFRCLPAQRSHVRRLHALTSPRTTAISIRRPRPTALTVLPRWKSEIAGPDRLYSDLTVGVPKETFPNERRVALTPQNVIVLLKKGFKQVLVEQGAGAEAQFTDFTYENAGAKLVDRKQLYAESDIILKVRPPNHDPAHNEVKELRPGTTLISFLQPGQNKGIVEALAERRATAFAMEKIPRISRAQSFDALSSMANIAGYKAVLEASNHFGRFLTGQTTAAGKIPPSKVLVIGAGVAGLSAITTARRLGAIVRGFDTRSAAREQVQSLGAEFLEVDIKEEGAGAGGYGKEMSKEFIDAEMKLFMEQCRDVDIVITTAMIPGRPAPRLITKEMVSAMKAGSVIVDLAAESGGNCEKTIPGTVTTYDNVTIIGYTDLPSRLPTQSSSLYSNNITKFLLSISPEERHFAVDMEDEVVRGAIVTQNGEIIPPAPRPPPTPPPPQPSTAAGVKEANVVALTPFQKTTRDVAVVTGGMGSMLVLGKFTSPLFMSNIFTAGLASLIG